MNAGEEEIFAPLHPPEDFSSFLHELQLLCSERVTQMTKTYDDIDAVTLLLEEKGRDIELAAQIGKSLLEKNQELQLRNDYMEESLAAANERLRQMQHDLEAKSALMRLYSEAEALDSPDSPSTSATRSLGNIQAKLDACQEENRHLVLEASTLKELTMGLEEREQALMADFGRQQDAKSRELGSLKTEVAEKSEQAVLLQSRITTILQELAEEKLRGRALEAAQEAQAELVEEILELQERYSELMAILAEAQEELKLFRRAPSSVQADSLYDSLASELEASDSGFHPSPCISSRSGALGPADLKLHPPNTLENLAAELSASTEAPTPTAASIRHKDKTESIPDDPGTGAADGVVSPTSLATPSTRALRTPSPVPVLGPGDRLSPDYSPPASSPPKRLAELRTANLGGRLSQKGSTDSLASYAGPAVGEPGEPGTRDLDYSLRKNNTRRKVELDFLSFQRQRGYQGLPVPFNYPPIVTCTPSHSSNGVHKRIELGGGGLLNRWKQLAKQKTIGTATNSTPRSGIKMKTERRSPPRAIPSSSTPLTAANRPSLALSPIKESSGVKTRVVWSGGSPQLATRLGKSLVGAESDGMNALLDAVSPVKGKGPIVSGVLLRSCVQVETAGAERTDYSTDGSVD